MNVTNVLFAQALRFTTVKASIYVPDAIKLVQERYGFVRVPVTAEEMLSPPNGAKPLTFTHGKLVHADRTIIIEHLNIYPQAIAVDTLSSTDDADIVLDDILREGAALVGQTVPIGVYVSHLEVVLQTSLDTALPVAQDLADTLSASVNQYPRMGGAPFHVSAIAMSPDPALGSLPCDFRVERRANVPYERNVYFSQAPLRTSDHVAALTALERHLAGPPVPEP